MRMSPNLPDQPPRPSFWLQYLSLFSSVGTLLCCALRHSRRVTVATFLLHGISYTLVLFAVPLKEGSAFIWLMMIVILASPLLLLLRKPRPRTAEPAPAAAE